MIKRIEILFAYPSVYQGILAGIFLFAAKIVVYVTQHWEYRFLPAFTFCSFLIILAAMILGSQSDRKQAEDNTYYYKQALLSCLRAVSFAVIIGSFADFFLYNFVDSTLVSQSKTIIIEQIKEGFSKTKIISNSELDLWVAETRKSSMGTFWYYFLGLPGLIFSNMVFGLVVARIMRVKKTSHWIDQ